MESKNLLTLAITLTVGIILAGSLLMPVISEATTTERTFENEGYFFMDKLSDSDETTHTIAWDVTNAKILTVDGEDMDVSTWGLGAYQQVTVFATETDIIRLGVPYDPASGLQWIQIRGGTIAYAAASSKLAATIGGGEASILLDSEESPRTLTYDDAYLISPDKAGYVMKKSDESASVKSDSEIYGIGYTSVTYNGSTIGTVFCVAGTIDSMTATSVMTTTPAITTSDIEVTAPAKTGYVDLYEFSKVTFVATAGTDTTDCIYSYVIVPASVTAELSQHLAPGEIAILNALPVLIIVALVVMAAGALYLKRDD